MRNPTIPDLPVDTLLGESRNVALLAHNEKIQGTGRYRDEVSLQGQLHRQGLQTMEEGLRTWGIQLLWGGGRPERFT